MTRGTRRKIVGWALVAPALSAVGLLILGALYGMSASIAKALGVRAWVVAAIVYGIIGAAAAGMFVLTRDDDDCVPWYAATWGAERARERARREQEKDHAKGGSRGN